MNPQTEKRELLQSVVEILRQGESLLGELSDEQYTCKIPAAFNASIGGHYRHCLDHFCALFQAMVSGQLNYDARERDTPIETDRFVALQATRELLANWQNVNLFSLARPLNVTCKTSYAAAGSQTAASTVAREIMYAVAHAVHHYALINIMAGSLEIKLTPGFGIAPSTVAHQTTVAVSA